MKTIIPSVKGTRDFYPEAMAVRSWLYASMREVAESFGFQEYEAPLIELIDLYAAKSGDELVKQQSFVFEDRGGNLVTLRPELTPSLVRMVAQRQNQLVFPLRWWSFGPFWRYEKPQKGRTREFFQWNVDILGSDSPSADAELASIIATFFERVGMSPDQVILLVNNRQLIEGELSQLGIIQEKMAETFRIIDRREKMQASAWESFAVDQGLSAGQIRGILDILVDDGLWKKSEPLQRFFQDIDNLGFSQYVRFAPYVIRGLDYYTGIVFEAQAQSGDVRRSILGGGRYDNLISDVGGQPMPATGFAMGDVVISLVLEELNLIPASATRHPARIYVTVFEDKYRMESLRLANELRQAGINTITSVSVDKLVKQLKYADRIGVELVALLGPEEIENQTVTVKNLLTRVQQTFPRQTAIPAIRAALEGR